MDLDTVIPAIFTKIRPGSTFLTIRSYRNNFNELSDYQVVFHVNYKRAIASSLKLLDRIEVDKNWGYVAREELRASFIDTLGGYNPRYTCHGVYEKVTYGGEKIGAIKWHIRGDAIHLEGFLLRKRVIERGTYPIVASHPKTIEKDRIRDKLPIGRFRQFKLVEGRFGLLSVGNMRLSDEELLRKLVP